MVFPCLTTRGTWSRNGFPLSYYPSYLEQEWFSPVLLPEVPEAARKGSPLSYYLEQKWFSPVLLPEVPGAGNMFLCPTTRGT